MDHPLIVFTAAHAGFAAQAPLGGGAAIANALATEWHRTQPFDFIMLGTGPSFPVAERYHSVLSNHGVTSLTQLSETQYAAFSRNFEEATTNYLLNGAARKPGCVLANDISEGPRVEALALRGIPTVTIFHVDVVDYFCKFYLRGARPERLTHWYERLRRRRLHAMLPAILPLVFEKQRSAVLHARAVIVPSSPMREVIEKCYPQKQKAEIQVIPWGAIGETHAEDEVEREGTFLRHTLGIESGEVVLLTLGRLSPEKGLHVLLKALQYLERDKNCSILERLRLLICGEAAYMRRERYLRELKREASRLKRVRVDFLGHVTGARKQALLQLGHLYVHPSLHESYGLTIVEAMRAEVPVLTSDHYSARGLVTDDCGIVVPYADKEAVKSLSEGLHQLIARPERLAQMGANAKKRTESMCFSSAAARVAQVVLAAACDRGNDRSLALPFWREFS